MLVFEETRETLLLVYSSRKKSIFLRAMSQLQSHLNTDHTTSPGIKKTIFLGKTFLLGMGLREGESELGHAITARSVACR